MPTTAPSTAVKLLLIKRQHLKYKLDHRPAATYFTAPLADIRALERINDRLRLYGIEPQETTTHAPA
jgi:hypothetical protein